MSIVDMLGRTIVLSGTHAFEWQVTIVGENSLTVIKFANKRVQQIQEKEMISTEDIITIILIIAFFVYLASKDKKSK